MLGLRHDLLALQIFVEMESASSVVLNYELRERPRLIRHKALIEENTPIVWLYDEFAADKRRLTHSVLLTSGWELQLRFHKLKARDMGKIVLAAAGEREGLDSLMVG